MTRNLPPCYAIAVDEAKAMAEDGADLVITRLGVTAKGSIGATTATILEEAPAKVQGLCDAAKSVNSGISTLLGRSVQGLL